MGDLLRRLNPEQLAAPADRPAELDGAGTDAGRLVELTSTNPAPRAATSAEITRRLSGGDDSVTDPAESVTEEKAKGVVLPPKLSDYAGSAKTADIVVGTAGFTHEVPSGVPEVCLRHVGDIPVTTDLDDKRTSPVVWNSAIQEDNPFHTVFVLADKAPEQVIAQNGFPVAEKPVCLGSYLGGTGTPEGVLAAFVHSDQAVISGIPKQVEPTGQETQLASVLYELYPKKPWIAVGQSVENLGYPDPESAKLAYIPGGAPITDFQRAWSVTSIYDANGKWIRSVIDDEPVIMGEPDRR